MSTPLKMTKQGLRDLNHYGPRPKAAAPEEEATQPPAAAAAVTDAANVVAEAPSGVAADAVARDGGGVS